MGGRLHGGARVAFSRQGSAIERAHPELCLVAPLDLGELGGEGVAKWARQKRRAVDLSLASADHDRVTLEVDVLGADAEAFEQAEAAAVEHVADEAEGRLELVDGGQGVPAVEDEDGGEVLGALSTLDSLEGRHLRVEDALVEEEDRAAGLVLGGCPGAALDGEVVEEGGDLGCTRVLGVPAIVKALRTPGRGEAAVSRRSIR